MPRRFAAMGLSVLMLAGLTSVPGSMTIAVSPPAADHLAFDVRSSDPVAAETISPVVTGHTLDATGSPALTGTTGSAFDTTQPAGPIDATDCIFCVLSDALDRYTLRLDRGSDLRVDGGVMVNNDSWYEGTLAVNRCGSSPCTPPTCLDWSPSPAEDRILMCGTSFYVDHTVTSTVSTLSARTISLSGGWQARNNTDVVHADQLAGTCPAHPKYLGYPVALQETNVCIGVPQIVDPLNDPGNPANVVPVPDFQVLSTCPGGLCGPVASATCAAEPGSTLRLPTGTIQQPVKLNIAGTTAKYTICPGLYFGGFSVMGDNSAQPRVIMLPGTYAMIGGGFSVIGRASITSVSSQGDGVAVYNTGGNVDLRTSDGPVCGAATAPCGQIVLHAPSSGRYGGLLVFQDRTDVGRVTIAPLLGAPACVGDWMTDGVPPDTNAVPDPCGPLGGLRGTIYAPHQSTGSPADFDSIVEIEASGVANLQVIAAEIQLTALNGQTRLTFPRPAADRLVVTPSIAMIAPGASQAYTAEAFDDNGDSLGDVTSSSTFGIVPDGSCMGASCTATVSGSHTVTATNGGVTASATLTVIPGPFDHPALIPAAASIAAGGVQTYAAVGRDAFDNSLGTLAGFAYTISPNGSCTGSRCTASLAGVHTVTGTKSGMTATATLTVNPGPLDHLVLGPATASVLAGVAQSYAAEGRDRFNNSLGDVTSGTAFSVAPNGGCTGASCTATTPGNHTVTGVNSGKLGRATLTVKAGPLDHLALAPASASIAFGGGQTYSATGRDAFNNSLGTQSGVVYTVSPDGSCSSARCTPAAVGPHTVTGTKAGVTGTANLTVTRATPTLTYTGKTAAVAGAPITLSATLKRPGGAAIAGAVISFIVGGQATTATTNASGVASTISAAPATPGTYLISVAFAGDASFNSASASKSLVVS